MLKLLTATVIGAASANTESVYKQSFCEMSCRMSRYSPGAPDFETCQFNCAKSCDGGFDTAVCKAPCGFSGGFLDMCEANCDAKVCAAPGSRGEFVKDTKGDLSDVFFNEIHYDNAKKLNSDGELTSALSDVGEGYEIAGKAGTDLGDYYVVHYNGRNGMKYGSNKGLDGKLVDKKCGWGFKWFNAQGLQNGAPDGIALVRQHGTRDRSNTPIKDDEVIQFLSYEGTFTAEDGPAKGMLSTEINVNQQNPKGITEHTMQLVGSYPNFKWEENIAKTHDLVNTGQEFCTATPTNIEVGDTVDEHCDADNCMNWSCAEWCECYNESKLDIYSSYPECQDDNDDTCICFDNEEHELYGERHRKMNYRQDAVDGSNVHTATKQNHYQEATPTLTTYKVVSWGRFSPKDRSDYPLHSVFFEDVEEDVDEDVMYVATNFYAFAALKNDGSVVTWGDPTRGGDSSYRGGATSSVESELTGVVNVTGTNYGAFAAWKTDGSVVTWGLAAKGGDSLSVASELSSDVVDVTGTASAFAALKNDGSVVTWGDLRYGGDSSSVSAALADGVVSISSTSTAFAALKNDGSVVTWGFSHYGGASSGVSSKLAGNVVSITGATYAFAALKNDGSVVTWGSSAHGGGSSSVSAELSSGVVSVEGRYCDAGFAAIKDDGSVVTWGVAANGGDSSSVASEISSGVVSVATTRSAMAALKNDGSVVAWGNSDYGGDTSSVASEIASDVISITSNRRVFAATKSDGTVVTWGFGYGSDSSSVASELVNVVDIVGAGESGFAALIPVVTASAAPAN